VVALPCGPGKGKWYRSFFLFFTEGKGEVGRRVSSVARGLFRDRCGAAGALRGFPSLSPSEKKEGRGGGQEIPDGKNGKGAPRNRLPREEKGNILFPPLKEGKKGFTTQHLIIN